MKTLCFYIKDENDNIGIFNPINSEAIVNIDEDTCEEMMKKLCVLIWSLYRIEWWFEIRSKNNKDFSSKIRPKHFPHSLNEVRHFLDNHKELDGAIKPHRLSDNSALGKVI